ncbi:MAG: choice-of-anchor D domain-containing protein [Terriglobales bacterium]
MQSILRLSGVCVAVLLVCAFWALSALSQAALGQTMPHFNHIIWVMEENLNYSDITSATWPNLYALGHTYGYSTNFFSDTHPSIGNYEEDISGQILTNDDSCDPNGSGGSDCPFPSTVDNIVRELLAQGLTWKSYAECIPNAGYLGGNYVAKSCPTDLTGNNTYYVRHNPFPYYSDVYNNQTQADNIVPFSQFATDVAAKNLPNLTYVAPDGCDDAHDCPSYPGHIDLNADTWLQTNVIGPLTDPSGYGPTFDAGDLLIVTFDESRNDDQNGGGKIFIAMVSPKYSTMGYVSNVSYGEGALACTLLQGLGLTAVYGDACSTQPPTQYATAAMSDFFGQTQSFSLSANPSTLSIAQGSTGTSTIAVTDNDGFNGQVTLGASGLPSGVTAQFNPNPTTTTSTLALTVASGAALGTSTITISGVSGSLTNQTTISLTVAASGPIVSLSPTSLTFPKTDVGATSKSKTVTLTNTGASTLNITSITPSGDFAVQSTTCGGTLAPKAKCTVKVTFTPTQVGTRTGTLSFTDNAPGSPQTVALSGTGIAQATLTPASETYSNQKVGTTSKAKKFTLTNNQAVELTGIAISTTGDFAVSAQTCGSSLAAKKKCTIDVTFTPTQTGTRMGQLSVSDSASNSPQAASLTGTGD